MRRSLAMHEYWFHKTSKEYLWEQMTRPQADYSRFIRLDIVGARNVSSVVSEHAEMQLVFAQRFPGQDLQCADLVLENMIELISVL